MVEPEDIRDFLRIKVEQHGLGITTHDSEPDLADGPGASFLIRHKDGSEFEVLIRRNR